MLAQKRPAEDGEQPAAKVMKTEDGAEEVKKEVKVESEQDEKADRRKQFAGVVSFEPGNCTINVVPASEGRVLMALSDAGMQYLMAGARANVGVKAGRYLFEARVMECLNPLETGRRATPNMPKQMLRIGFSTSSASLFLADSEESVCFDSEGFFHAGKTKKSAGARLMRDHVIGILLNLDPKSPNANTISLFRDGERMCDPQPIPDECKGKPLFPHVCYRNVTLQVHFGPEPMTALPFKCRTIAAGAGVDMVVAPSTTPKDGKYEVLFPVGLPDEGTFDWLDGFLAKHPGYVELSDRTIVEWAQKSGFPKPKVNQWKHSNDKPDVNFGVQALDELSARRVISSVAPLVPRNYVVMEVKGNLVEADRKELMKRFSAPCFKKAAVVVMGEPPNDHKARVKAERLSEKQENLNQVFKAKVAERERKKLIEQRQKELEKARKEAAAKAQMEVDGEGEVKAEGEVKEEEKEEVKEEDEKKEEEEELKEPAKACLSPEEEKMWFKSQATGDLTAAALAAGLATFSLPSKEEGFADIRYEWQKEPKCKEYVKKWILDKKLSTRVEDIAPNEWFFAKVAEYQKALQEWQAKGKEWKSAKLQEQFQKAQEKFALQQQQQMQQQQQQAAEGQEGGEGQPAAEGAEGEAKAEGAEGEAKAAEGAEAEKAEPKAEEAEKAEEVKAPIDTFAAEDVMDVGDGEPLFANFMFEDWALVTLRFEMNLLAHAFKRDTNDPDRPGMHESHLAFYYQKYFRKALNFKFYGKENVKEVLDMVQDTMTINAANSIVLSSIAEDKIDEANHFLRLTEAARRERQTKIDGGDEEARLRFSPLATQAGGMAGKGQARVIPSQMAPRPMGAGGWQAGGGGGWQKGGWQAQGYGGAGGWQAQGARPMQPQWGGASNYAPKAAGWR